MKQILFLILMVCVVVVSQSQHQPSPQGTLFVSLIGLRSDDGTVYISLFRSQDGFPSDASKALCRQKSKIEDRRCSFIFKDLEYGEYAVSTIHDENDNGKLDTGCSAYPKKVMVYRMMREDLWARQNMTMRNSS